MGTLIFAGKQLMRTRDPRKQDLVRSTAIDLLVKKGFEGFSMNGLAKACGISVATLYIYYKDKEDLIGRLGREEGERMTDAVMKDFDPALPFEDGLRVQWKNRCAYYLAHPTASIFYEQLHTSTYFDQTHQAASSRFRDILGKFMKNAVARGEVDPMPVEVYWSVAYGPLYTLIRFHREARSIGGRPFQLSPKILWQTFDIVLKSLQK